LLQDIANSSYWQLRTCTPHMIIIIQIWWRAGAEI
jgi:hypothetical protein